MARKLTAGPFSDPELLILASLAEGQKHGYAIMTDVLTFAEVELGPGTLYSAITRLVEMGWIEPCQPSGRQRPYKITPAGGLHLQTQLAKMRHLAKIGLKRLRVI
jgi:DNA-binding PadR family transcriptional regulator